MLKSASDEQESIALNIEKYIENPINAFKLIKRLSADINLVKFRLEGILANFKNSIKNIEVENSDLSGAIDGLFKVQNAYKLKSSDFAEGIIDGEMLSASLSANDLSAIGIEASIQENYKFTIEYINLALEKYEKLDELDKRDIDETLLLRMLATTFDKIRDKKNAELILQKILEKDQTNEFALSMIKQYQVINVFSEDFVKDGTYTVEKERIFTDQICRVDKPMPIKELSKLRCRYSSTNYFTKIAPFKLEEAKLEPYVVIFIDVISDDEIEHLKAITKPRTKRATTDHAATSSKIRVAKIAWHYDTEDSIVARISRRVEDMTGLTTKTAEPLQVQNYGVGGAYQIHTDYDTNLKNFENGNRIATVLFYMTNVEKGGATVFPYLSVRVPVRKGNAAFWFNLNESGECNPLTRHSACPVLLGSKWVANKWLHEYGQEFRRQCGLKFKEIDNLFYQNYL